MKTLRDHVREIVEHTPGWDYVVTRRGELRCWPVPRGDREDVWMGVILTENGEIGVGAAEGPSRLIRECLVEIEGFVREAQQRMARDA